MTPDEIRTLANKASTLAMDDVSDPLTPILFELLGEAVAQLAQFNEGLQQNVDGKRAFQVFRSN